MHIWHTHNVIEVGTSEQFFLAPYAQRDNPQDMHYSRDMAPSLPSATTHKDHARELFETRVNGYREAQDASAYQRATERTFL